MAVQLQTWTTIEIRSVIRFLNARNVSPAEIHQQLVDVYGVTVLSRKQVYFWCNEFNAGRTNVVDEQRSGRASSSATEENIGKIDDFIRQDRWVKIRQIANAVGISKSSVHEIVHDTLHYRKVCARWVPKHLTDLHKAARMGASLTNLQRYHEEGEEFLNRIVTGDETWVHFAQPETKRDSMTWKHFDSPPPRKFKAVPSAKKIMATVFWDRCGVLMVDFLRHGFTVNAEQYCRTLDKLRNVIRKKRSGLISTGVILLHDNATPHTAAQMREWLERYKWEVLSHPPYSPDLVPSDFYLFGPLKRHLSGQTFTTDADCETAVKQWLSSNVRQFYQDGIIALVTRWDKCLNRFGDYVEK